ncbi:MAG: hypothetical protein ABIN95_02805, partial [Mucilaginibacter sp.]
QKKSTITDKDTIPVAEKTPVPEVKHAVPVQKSNSLTAILTILCLVFLGTSVWLYLQWQKAKPVEVQTVTNTAPHRNDQEILLQDAFDNVTGDTLVLSDTVFKSPVLISDTLHIKADSLYIKVKGNIVLQRDTAYHGPALVISPTAKITVLDSLLFSDFPTAIYVNNTALYLKKTRFINCPVPVRNTYLFGGKQTITARLPVLVLPADSSAKKPVPVNGTR